MMPVLSALAACGGLVVDETWTGGGAVDLALTREGDASGAWSAHVRGVDEADLGEAVAEGAYLVQETVDLHSDESRRSAELWVGADDPFDGPGPCGWPVDRIDARLDWSDGAGSGSFVLACDPSCTDPSDDAALDLPPAGPSGEATVPVTLACDGASPEVLVATVSWHLDPEVTLHRRYREPVEPSTFGR